MTTSTLQITVGDRTHAREDALTVGRAIDSADSVTAAAESVPDHLQNRAVLQFGSYDELVDHLSPLRLELIQTIVQQEPDSIRETARCVGRDVSDVHSDLKRLAAIDIVDFEERGNNGAMQPLVPYDRIEMHIDYPLIEDNTDTGTALNAD